MAASSAVASVAEQNRDRRAELNVLVDLGKETNCCCFVDPAGRSMEGGGRCAKGAQVGGLLLLPA
jgi:hypothetical protein